MSEFWPFPLTSYHLSELSFDWVFFLQIQNLSLFYHFPKLLNFSSPGTDTASTKPFLEAGPHWNLQVLSKFYHLTELVFIEKYPYHLSELSYEWVIFFAPSARFYHMTELSYDRITTVVQIQTKNILFHPQGPRSFAIPHVRIAVQKYNTSANW